ncbi:unnamed protein product, partial [Prorocentrum cordatum]
DTALALFPRGAGGSPPEPLPQELGCACCGSDGGARRLLAVTARAYVQFALRLDVEALRPCFAKVVSWARGPQERVLLRQADRKALKSAAPDVPGDADDACRALALFSVMDALVAEVAELAEDMLLPLTYKDLASCLGASRLCAQRLAAQNKPTGAKRKAGGASAQKVLQGHTWWWFEVSTAALGFLGAAVAPAGERSETSKAVAEAISELREPCCNMLDVFALLPALEERPLRRSSSCGPCRRRWCPLRQPRTATA